MNDGIKKCGNDSLSNLLTRSTIREANNHLQMLHKHNQDLQQLIDQQKNELEQKNLEYKRLFQKTQYLEKHCQQLQTLLDDRTRRLQIYERKDKLFRETLELKPAIESLLEVLTIFEKEDNTLSLIPLQFVQLSNSKKNRSTVDRTMPI